MILVYLLKQNLLAITLQNMLCCAMGSPPAPLLANGWLRKFDDTIKGDADVYTRYMDEILRDISSDDIDDKLVEINNLHPSLKFTIEREVDSSIPFLDMRITRSGDTLQSTWYTKPTDTGLTMNYHALAPTRYKKSVVIGFIHQIFYACSSWKTFHESLVKAKSILQRDQYPEILCFIAIFFLISGETNFLASEEETFIKFSWNLGFSRKSDSQPLCFLG